MTAKYDVKKIAERLRDERGLGDRTVLAREAAAAIEWMDALLRGRDNFIIDRGLWQDFVDTLPR